MTRDLSYSGLSKGRLWDWQRQPSTSC